MKVPLKSLVFALFLMMVSLANPAFAADLRDINTATAAQLMEVKGVGEKTAAAIISYREAHHGIKDMKELLEVKGVGEKTLEKVKAMFGVVKAQKAAPAKEPAPAKPAQ